MMYEQKTMRHEGQVDKVPEKLSSSNCSKKKSKNKTTYTILKLYKIDLFLIFWKIKIYRNHDNDWKKKDK